jgi:tetratricopeptide (TPR) repeat protein
VADEAEYAFMHVLVRDVAYGQIPRGERAEKHRIAAKWIATLGRPEDHAEMVAHHYTSALELTRATGQHVDPAFAAGALTSLRDAGERAASLNADAAAAGFFASAIELAEPGSIGRARLLFRLGQSRHRAGASDPVLLAEASADLLVCGDPETAAEAECVLSELEWLRGDAGESMRHLNRARALVDDREASRVKALVVSTVSRYLMLAGESAEAIRIGRDAAAMAEQFGLEAVRANALNNIGASRCHSGDPAGIDDLEEAIVLAEHANAPAEFCRARANLASVLWMRGSLERSASLRTEAQALASRFGQPLLVRWLRGATAREAYVLGLWDEAQTSVDEFIAEVEAGSPHYLAGDCYSVRAHLRLARDDGAGARTDAEKAVDFARLAKDPQMLYPTLAGAADVFSELGDRERATVLVDELLEQLQADRVTSTFVTNSLHTLAWTMTSLGRDVDMAAVLPDDGVPWVHAARAFVAGDLRHAADTCRAMGARTEEARDRLWLAKALFVQHRHVEAETELQHALDFYRSVGATRYIREGGAMRTPRTVSFG